MKQANTLFHSKRKWFKHFKSEQKGNNISLVFSQFQYCPETSTKEQCHAVAPYARICNSLKKLIMLLLSFTQDISPKNITDVPVRCFFFHLPCCNKVFLIHCGPLSWNMVDPQPTTALGTHTAISGPIGDLWGTLLSRRRVPQRKSGWCYEDWTTSKQSWWRRNDWHRMPQASSSPLHPASSRDMGLSVLQCRFL